MNAAIDLKALASAAFARHMRQSPPVLNTAQQCNSTRNQREQKLVDATVASAQTRGRKNPNLTEYPEDWRTFFDERAAIAERDGEQTRAEAEAIAFESCIIEWLNRHPIRSDPDRCAWCEKPDSDGHAVVPFGTESHGHIWLHPECWPNWFEHRRQQATEALARMGIRPTEHPNGKTD